MAVTRKDRKMKTIEEENDLSIRLHTNSCDKLYRWSMWRMYLNEELSRVITSRYDFSDQSKSVNKVTTPYLRHRDGVKYGRHMKKLFQKNVRSTNSLDILPDNMYLVYGLPRVSIHNVPEEVKRLHESVKPSQTYASNEHRDTGTTSSVEYADAGEQITKMFEFVTSDFTKGDVSQLTFRKLGGNKPRVDTVQNGNSQSHAQERNRTLRRKMALPSEDIPERNGGMQSQDHNTIRRKMASSSEGVSERNIDHGTGNSDTSFPLVSKSRLFWERLANKKTDIIDLKNKNGRVNEVNASQSMVPLAPPPPVKSDHKQTYVIPPAPDMYERKHTSQYAIPPAPYMYERKHTSQNVIPPAPAMVEIKQTSQYTTPIAGNITIPPAPVMSETKQTSQYAIPPAPFTSEVKQTTHYTVLPEPAQPVAKVTKQATEEVVISNDILQKQQKLLKKTIPKRTSKDLWRSLRDRKTEILQMREMNDREQVSMNHAKKPESKTSQLWGFLFSKKKELVQLKHGYKGNQESGKGHQQQERGKKHHNTSNDNAHSNAIPSNFEDNFQKELAAKLRRRREQSASIIESSNL